MKSYGTEKDRAHVLASVWLVAAVYMTVRVASGEGPWYLFILRILVAYAASYYFIGYAFRDLSGRDASMRLKRKKR